MSADVEIPALYIDALVPDDLGLAAAPWLALYGRDPGPGDTAITVDFRPQFTLSWSTGGSLASYSIWIKIGDGSEFLIYDSSPFTSPGWSVDLAALAPGVLNFLITPPTDFPPLTVVQLRVDAATAGGLTVAETWSFTTEDLITPVLVSATARASRTIRVVFNEPVSDTALEAANYVFTRQNVYPRAAVEIAAVSVTRVSSAVVDVTLDREMSQGVTYLLTVSGVEDLFENEIEPPDNLAVFDGLLCANAPADRRFELWRMIPQKNRDEDATQELEAFFSCLQDVTDLLLCSIDEWTDILDPDKAPEIFVDAMLQDLGNPFEFDLTLQEKRRLVSVLVAAYKQKGTAVGIVNLVRLFLGLEVTVIPFNGGGGSWILGETELGDAMLGSDVPSILYTFEIVTSELLTDEQRETIRTIANYMKPAHTHLARIAEPPTPMFVDHVELGLSELGVEFILH